MEVKINKEIRDYRETVFFGMDLRQLCCAFLACVAAVVLYFTLRLKLSAESCSWICILGAAPFAALGFVSYHGMHAEELLLVWVRDRILEPRVYPFGDRNLYEKARRGERKQKTCLENCKAAWKRNREDTGSRTSSRT